MSNWHREKKQYLTNVLKEKWLEDEDCFSFFFFNSAKFFFFSFFLGPLRQAGYFYFALARLFISCSNVDTENKRVKNDYTYSISPLSKDINQSQKPIDGWN